MVAIEKDHYRVTLADASMDECDALQQICHTWEDKEYLEGSAFEKDYIRQCLAHGDLPPIPGASIENYRLKSIRLVTSRQLVGFSDIYLGYPDEQTAWISIFLIDTKFRKQGYAREALEQIAHYCAGMGYESLAIGVHLKNWRALRFWYSAGFTSIWGISGDKDYANDAFAVIKLGKKIV
ncbi:MAG: GNAT family N-acetyltransferase [Bacteroidales bacterium]